MPAVRRSLLLRLFWRIHPWIYRVSGGRLGTRIEGMEVLLLTTVGRKSGLERTSTLYYFRDDDRFVIVASNAGYTRHPAWYFNLMAHPEATVQAGTSVVRVRAREADGDERARLWQHAVAIYQSYAEYQQRTERRIPIVVLEPIVMPGRGD